MHLFNVNPRNKTASDVLIEPLGRPLRLRSLAFVIAVAALLALHSPAAFGQANVTGTWQTVPTLMPINPVHTALMPNGKILVVSGSGNYPQQTTYMVGVWDPATNTASKPITVGNSVPDPPICARVSLMPVEARGVQMGLFCISGERAPSGIARAVPAAHQSL